MECAGERDGEKRLPPDKVERALITFRRCAYEQNFTKVKFNNVVGFFDVYCESLSTAAGMFNAMKLNLISIK